MASTQERLSQIMQILKENGGKATVSLVYEKWETMWRDSHGFFDAIPVFMKNAFNDDLAYGIRDELFYMQRSKTKDQECMIILSQIKP